MALPDLSNVRNKRLSLHRDLQPNLGGTLEDRIETTIPCGLVVSSSTVNLLPGNQGVWIPYVAGKATYGFFDAYPWAASGPFSGCELVIGQTSEGVYLAHIWRESGRTEALDAFADWGAGEPWYRKRIQLQVAHAYACYVFASGSHVGNLQIVRMDVQPTTPGGANGTILGVHQIYPPTSSSSRRSSCSCCVVM